HKNFFTAVFSFLIVAGANSSEGRVEPVGRRRRRCRIAPRLATAAVRSRTGRAIPTGLSVATSASVIGTGDVSKMAPERRRASRSVGPVFSPPRPVQTVVVVAEDEGSQTT